MQNRSTVSWRITLHRAMLARVFVACAGDRSNTTKPIAIEHYDAAPLWTSGGDITSIGAIHALSDGRVLVADFKDRTLWLLGNDGKPIRTITHQGSGPGEFDHLQGLWPLPGDSSLVYDDSQRRLIVVDANAKPAATILLPPFIPQMALGGMTQTDARGRIVTPSAFMLDSKETSVPLIRWDRANTHVDTVARVAVPMSSTVIKGNMMNIFVVPFTDNDWFHPLANGEIAIIRAKNFSVNWIDTLGKLRQANTIPFTPIAVRDTERLEHNGLVRPLIPSTKPPFDGYYAVAGDDGELWVRRQQVSRADSVDYDVLNAQGKRIRIFRLGPMRWVLAVKAKITYISHIDDDGFERLQAYARK